MIQFKNAKTGLHWITKKWTAHLIPGGFAVGNQAKLLIYRTESQVPDLLEASEQHLQELVKVVFIVKINDLRGRI